MKRKIEPCPSLRLLIENQVESVEKYVDAIVQAVLLDSFIDIEKYGGLNRLAFYYN